MLYHYTSEYIFDLIQNDGYIKTSIPKLKGHPRGVYLTDLPPSTNDRYLVRKLYGNKPYAYKRFQDRTEVCIIIKEYRLDYEQIREHVFYTEDDIDIERFMYGHINRK